MNLNGRHSPSFVFEDKNIILKGYPLEDKYLTAIYISIVSLLAYHEYVQWNVVLVYLVHSIAKLFNSSLWFTWGSNLPYPQELKLNL